MNLSLSDSLLGRQRCRQWTPLVTQQCRLRHVHRIFGFNLPPPAKKASYYFTLHLTSMSAPFFTSEKVEGVNPKWPELDQRNLPNLAATAVVLRIWCHAPDDAPDTIVTTWGVNFTGLVYLGCKISEIQPSFFARNSVIFCMRGGYFTSRQSINREGSRPPPFFENLNLAGTPEKILRRTGVQTLRSEVRDSYDIEKLRRLHSLQITIKNKSLDVENVREKIEVKCGADGLDGGSGLLAEERGTSSHSNVRYAPQLLTMNSLNRMLEEKPTRMQRKEMVKVRNQIELAQFRNKLLSQERDTKSALIRRFKRKLAELVDENEEANLELMEKYYMLSREVEKLKDFRKGVVQNQEALLTLHSQLFHRRKQLMQQLLFIYPIQQISEKKYTIHGICLPNSDILSDSSDTGVSVALGYVTHVLLMCSTFLQVPLRYPLTHCGSRSYIADNISHVLPEKEKEFPLFTKGKDKIQFTYAVYLLNKNIAQLRWLLFMHTPELKATLPNLLTLLQGSEARDVCPLVATACCDPKVDDLRKEETNMAAAFPVQDGATCQELSRRYVSKMYKSSECGPGLSEILAIPEAFMNRQISSESFKSYSAMKRSGGGDCAKTDQIVIKEGRADETNVCDTSEIIEQGTDLLDPNLNLSTLSKETVEVEVHQNVEEEDFKISNEQNGEKDIKNDVEKETKVEVQVEEEFVSKIEESKPNLEHKDDCPSKTDVDVMVGYLSKTDEARQDLDEGYPSKIESVGEAWPRNGSALVDQSIESTAVTSQSAESPLTARTDALLNTKSFNLVRPKSNL